MQTLTMVVDDHGVSGLWKGLRASLVLCVNPAITYGCFEKLKRMLLARRNNGLNSLTPLDAFILGAISKTLATVVTCIPL